MSSFWLHNLIHQLLFLDVDFISLQWLFLLYHIVFTNQFQKYLHIWQTLILFIHLAEWVLNELLLLCQIQSKERNHMLILNFPKLLSCGWKSFCYLYARFYCWHWVFLFVCHSCCCVNILSSSSSCLKLKNTDVKLYQSLVSLWIYQWHIEC